MTVISEKWKSPTPLCTIPTFSHPTDSDWRSNSEQSDKSHFDRTNDDSEGNAAAPSGRRDRNEKGVGMQRAKVETRVGDLVEVLSTTTDKDGCDKYPSLGNVRKYINSIFKEHGGPDVHIEVREKFHYDGPSDYPIYAIRPETDEEFEARQAKALCKRERFSLRKKHKARKALLDADLPLPPELEELPPL